MIGGLKEQPFKSIMTKQCQTVKVKRLAVPDVYVQHGSVPEVLAELHLSLDDIKAEINQVIKK